MLQKKVILILIFIDKTSISSLIDLSTRSNLNIPIVQISKSVAYSCIETVKEYFSYDKNALQKIKVMTINKLCRTINTIYFDLIEKVYFKKDKLKFFNPS